MNENIEYRILLIGDTLVGKTAFLQRYLNHEFTKNKLATIGIDSKIKIVQMEDGVKIQLRILDTAGGEGFRSITKKYYKNSHGILLFYDITNKFSFESINNWIKIINNEIQAGTPIFIVGNKIDDEKNRQITKEEGENLANNFGFMFSECSVKTGENVEYIFDKLIKIIHKKNYKKIELKEDIIFKELMKYISF